jgi:hypothetical protein
MRGIGGFIRGLGGGMALGEEIGSALDRGKEKRLLKKVGKEVEAARNVAREGLIDSQTYTPPADMDLEANPELRGLSTTVHKVDGKRHATREDAFKATDKLAPDSMDFYQKVAVPKLKDFYTQSGDIDKAEAWDNWAKGRDQQKAFEGWSKAYRASQIGDVDAVADYVFNQYKTHDDGIDAVSKEVVKKDGEVAGYNVTLKNKESGKEYSQFVDRDSLLNMGMQFFSPQQQFEMAYEQNQSALKAEGESAEADLKYNREMQGKQVDAQNAQNMEILKSQLKTREEQVGFDRKVNLLKERGYDENFINRAVPQLLGIRQGETGYRRSTSPEEMAKQLMVERMKDYKFQRMTPEEQQDTIRQDLDFLMSFAPSAKPTRPETSGLAHNVYDTQTGEIYRLN